MKLCVLPPLLSSNALSSAVIASITELGVSLSQVTECRLSGGSDIPTPSGHGLLVTLSNSSSLDPSSSSALVSPSSLFSSSSLPSSLSPSSFLHLYHRLPPPQCHHHHFERRQMGHWTWKQVEARQQILAPRASSHGRLHFEARN
jgi:hypothetical protein